MFFSVPGQNVGDGLLLIYLQILSSLTVNISKVCSGSSGGTAQSSHYYSGDSDDDSNSEMDHEESNVEELQVSTNASKLLCAIFFYNGFYLFQKYMQVYCVHACVCVCK
jgi:hypothetical protein